MLNEKLTRREVALNKSIAGKAAQVRNLENSLRHAEEELEALHNELAGVRDQLMEEFFSHHLHPLNLDFRIYTEEETLIEIISDETNPEYVRLLGTIGNQDPTALPLIYIYDFIGEGLPFNV